MKTILENFDCAVAGDITDKIFAEAVMSAARAIFEGDDTTALTVDVANVDGDKAKELAASMTKLAEDKAAADAVRETVSSATDLEEKATNEQKLAEADRKVAETAKVTAALANDSAVTQQGSQEGA